MKSEFSKISFHNHFGSDKTHSFDMEFKGKKRIQLSYDWKKSHKKLQFKVI